MREIEIKIKLTPQQQELLEKWLSANMEFKGESSQLEYYLNNPSNSFIFTHKLGYKDASDYFRVRFEKDGGSVCLKRFKIDHETGASENLDEVEFDVSDPDEALKLFATLGFSEQTKVAKQRQKYANADFEVVIDTVESLGSFAEFELKHEVADYGEGLQKLQELMKLVGISEYVECTRGYVSMLWNPDYDFGQPKTL